MPPFVVPILLVLTVGAYIFRKSTTKFTLFTGATAAFVVVYILLIPTGGRPNLNPILAGYGFIAVFAIGFALQLLTWVIKLLFIRD